MAGGFAFCGILFGLTSYQTANKQDNTVGEPSDQAMTSSNNIVLLSGKPYGSCSVQIIAQIIAQKIRSERL